MAATRLNISSTVSISAAAAKKNIRKLSPLHPPNRESCFPKNCTNSCTIQDNITIAYFLQPHLRSYFSSLAKSCSATDRIDLTPFYYIQYRHLLERPPCLSNIFLSSSPPPIPIPIPTITTPTTTTPLETFFRREPTPDQHPPRLPHRLPRAESEPCHLPHRAPLAPHPFWSHDVSPSHLLQQQQQQQQHILALERQHVHPNRTCQKRYQNTTCRNSSSNHHLLQSKIHCRSKPI